MIFFCALQNARKCRNQIKKKQVGITLKQKFDKEKLYFVEEMMCNDKRYVF